MDEDEIIKEFKDLIYNPIYNSIILKDEEGFTQWHELFENVLVLYNKEKERNKELEEQNNELIEINNKYNDMNYETKIAENYIPKSKVKKR